MKRLLLALPPFFLLLSVDRLSPGRLSPERAVAPTWEEAAPTLPGSNEGLNGTPGVPLSLVFVGTPVSTRLALTQAGWTEVPTSFRGSLTAGLGETFSGRPPVSWPPIADEHLLGRRQDMNWARWDFSRGRRRGFRLWRTGTVDGSGRDYWWGGVLDSNPDQERDQVASTLTESPFLDAIVIVAAPRTPRNAVDESGRPILLDGRVAVIALHSRGARNQTRK